MVSPTAIETPIDQVASSVTVITAKDMERDQRRTVPDALARCRGSMWFRAEAPAA